MLTVFGQTTTQNWAGSFIFLFAFFAVFYILIIMPRKKQEKKHKELVQNLRVHDRIVTIGGIHGQVKKVKDKTLVIKVSDDAELEIVKNAVAYLQDED